MSAYRPKLRLHLYKGTLYRLMNRANGRSSICIWAAKEKPKQKHGNDAIPRSDPESGHDVVNGALILDPELSHHGEVWPTPKRFVL